jgi:3-oxoacyl-[acyl-carrier protein] reductase
MMSSMYDVNVKGLLLATQAAVRLFPAEGGVIVNIGSGAAELAPPMGSVYAGTKAALNTMTRSLAKELGPKKIRVNAVNPGPVATEGFHAAGFAGSDFEKWALQNTPLGRLGEPDEIAAVVAFLVSNDARWVTGALIEAAGGLR